MNREEKLKQLSRLRDEMNSYRLLPKEMVEQLDKQVKIEHVWSSNAIEGSTLTRYETASIIDTGITVNRKSVRETLEAINLSEAYEYMMSLVSEKQDLSETIIRDLNRLATLNTAMSPELAGVYRITEAWPSGYEDHPYTEPFNIRPEVEQLIRWSKENRENLHPAIYAADLHQKFVSIHPFSDGNGRTARLLMNLSLTEEGYPVINIQPDRESREKYMEALAYSRQTGDLTLFENIIIDYFYKTLVKRLEILKLYEKNTEEAKKQTNLSSNSLKKKKER